MNFDNVNGAEYRIINQPTTVVNFLFEHLIVELEFKVGNVLLFGYRSIDGIETNPIGR